MVEEGHRPSNSGIKTKRKSVYEQQSLQTNNRQVASKLNRRAASLSEIKLDATDPGRIRKRSSIYYPVNKEDSIEETEIDYRERFRITLQEIYAEQDKEKDIVKRCRQQKTQLKLRESQQNTFFSFFKYMANEHESLLQIIVLSPLIVTSLYIIFVEKGSLIK